MSAASDNSARRHAVLVDRHPLWLEALERLLDRIGITVESKLQSAAAAVEEIGKKGLDLVITDLETVDGPRSGLDVLAAASKAGVSAIVVSEKDDPESVKAALGAGAAAYVLKSAEPGELTVAARQTFARSVYTRVPAIEEEPVAPQGDGGLTPREREVLTLAAQGRSNSQIATALRITEQTVKLHLANTFRKLDVSNRTQAARRAEALGLLRGRPSAEVELHLLISPPAENDEKAARKS